jgi:hypothetical protein
MAPIKKRKLAKAPKANEGEILDETYMVERIVKKKYENNQYMYYIKWEGYPSSDNTWEPASNLPTHMITEFEKKKGDKLNLIFSSGFKKFLNFRDTKAKAIG